MSERSILLNAKGLIKGYVQGQGRLEILKGIDFSLESRDAVSIVGTSGSGKSTLLHILGTLDRPDLGELFFQGESLSEKNDSEISLFRNQSMGFVFQFHYLLNEFTALENVAMPCLVAGVARREALQRAEKLLNGLGLRERMNHFPTQLSGGEQQRVAIARALVMKPQVLFADEPTGNLDAESQKSVQNLFFQLHKSLGVALVVVTHDRQFAQSFPRMLEMKNGFLIEAKKL